MSDEEYDCPEDHAYFNSDECICGHEDEDHGYGGCEVNDCECKANWEY